MLINMIYDLAGPYRMVEENQKKKKRRYTRLSTSIIEASRLEIYV